MTTPRVYPARERGTTSIPIEDVFHDGAFDIIAEVQGKEYFDVRFQRDRLVVTAGKYVGLIPLNDRVVIQVEPKMPVANLLAILAAVDGEVVQLAVLQREYPIAPEAPPHVLEAIVQAFRRALQVVEAEGLHKEYAPFVTDGSSLKGRIAFGASLQTYWSHGIRHAAVSEHFDLTANLDDNRLLRVACHFLLTRLGASSAYGQHLAALAHCDEWLERAGVELALPSRLDQLHREPYSPSYARALRLAHMIVKRQGIAIAEAGSDVVLPSFLIDMETLFEDYMRHILSTRLTGCSVLDGNDEGQRPLFDGRPSPAANPDVVVQPHTPAEPLVVEVKYKSSETRDDINQVIAYAACYRTTSLVIVLPAESASQAGLTTIGTIDGLTLHSYRFNLAAEDLVAEEARYATTMHKLTAMPPAS